MITHGYSIVLDPEMLRAWRYPQYIILILKYCEYPQYVKPEYCEYTECLWEYFLSEILHEHV